MRALAGLCGKTSQMGAQQAVLQLTGGFARLPDAAGQARAKADRNFNNFHFAFSLALNWHLSVPYSSPPLLPPPLGTYQISTNHPRLSTPAPHGPIAVAQRAAPAADYFPLARALRYLRLTSGCHRAILSAQSIPFAHCLPTKQMLSVRSGHSFHQRCASFKAC